VKPWIRQWVWFWLLLLVTTTAEARVFNFKNEYLASYLRATGGPSGVGKDAFKGAGGTGTSYADSVAYNFSGEIGFLLRFKDRVTFRAGMELLQTKPLKEIAGKNAAGTTTLFNLTSEVLILHPTGTFEFNIAPDTDSRTFLFLGAGVADITVDNEFALTTDGETNFGITSFTEKMEAYGLSYHGGIGYETLMADTVTVSFELGYRYLPINELKFKSDVTTIAQGAVTKGTVVRNADGGKRSLDMSGVYVSMGFRFYIDFTR
jgi:hypothetical protein